MSRSLHGVHVGGTSGADRLAAYVDLVRDIASAANLANSFDEAAQICLDRVCEFAGWPVGHVYVAAPEGADELWPTGVWHLDDDQRYAAFRDVTMRTPLRRNIGLPGEILAHRGPRWITDLAQHSNYPRGQTGVDVGIRGAFAFPVLVGDEVVAVLEFFAAESARPDPMLLEMAGTVGAHLGRVVERQRAAEALAASEERARRIVETANDAFIAIDADGRVTEWNTQSEKMFGWHRTEVLGRLLVDVILPERFQEAHRRGIAHFRATGEGPVLGTTVELSGLHRDGHEIPLELTVWALAEPPALVFNAFLRDISERKRAQEQLHEEAARLAEANAALRRADAVKDDFLAVTSHELRTPLTAIVGYSQLLRARWDEMSDQSKRDALHIIERQSEQLRLLVSDLLTISTIQAGALEIHVEPVAVAAVIARAQQALAPAAADIAVTGADGVHVLADVGRFEQALANLLTNAVKYGAPPYWVEVVVTGADVELRVRDHGPGVPEDFLPQLFDKFTQASRGDRRDAHGAGLGLAIVRSLVEAQGGAVWYEPSADGGACFGLRLPAAR